MPPVIGLRVRVGVRVREGQGLRVRSSELGRPPVLSAPRGDIEGIGAPDAMEILIAVHVHLMRGNAV